VSVTANLAPQAVQCMRRWLHRFDHHVCVQSKVVGWLMSMAWRHKST